MRSAELQQQQQQLSLPPASASVAPPLSSTLPTSLNARPAEREREKPKRDMRDSTPASAAKLAAPLPATPQSPEADGANSEASSDRALDSMAQRMDAVGAKLEQRQRETRALEEEQLRRYREQLQAERVAEERRLAVEHERAIRCALLCSYLMFRILASLNHFVINEISACVRAALHLKALAVVFSFMKYNILLRWIILRS